MKTKIPPPIIMIFFGTCILLSKRIFPNIDFGNVAYVGFLFYGLAAFLILNSISTFRKHKTTVNPLKPESASSLVTSGVFQITRNPMYLAMAFILIALSIHRSAVGGIVFIPLFIGYITKFQIIPEEAAMQKLFGDEFSTYKNKVRRWL